MSASKAAGSEGPNSSRVLLALAAVGVCVLAAIYAPGLFANASPASLSDRALNASSPEQQVEAAQQLAQLGKAAVEELRKVAGASSNDEVIAVCMMGLGRIPDPESMDLFLAKLDDESADIRAAAAKACKAILGRNHHFPVNGKPEERARIKQQMEKDWEAYNGSILFNFNMNERGKEN